MADFFLKTGVGGQILLLLLALALYIAIIVFEVKWGDG